MLVKRIEKRAARKRLHQQIRVLALHTAMMREKVVQCCEAELQSMRERLVGEIEETVKLENDCKMMGVEVLGNWWKADRYEAQMEVLVQRTWPRPGDDGYLNI